MTDSLEPIREKSESIFGPGAGSFFAQLTIVAIALGLMFVVLTLGVFVKRETQSVLYGEPAQTQPALQPGETAVINGVKIKRVN